METRFPESTEADKLERLRRIKSEIDTINNFLFQTEIIITRLFKFSDYIKALNLNAKRRFLLKHQDNSYLMLDDCKRYIRIFNDADMEKGGRIYAPFQQFSKKTRQHFLMNNEPVELVDISSSHVRMLYHILDLDFHGDAYGIIFDKNIHSVHGIKTIRKINKKILQTLLNSKTEKSAIRSAFRSIKTTLKKEIRRDVADRFDTHEYARQWINRFKQKHDPIKEYFHSGYGITLQYIESEIIIQSILKLIDMNIPALSLHDELVVPHSQRNIAKNTLKQEYKKYSQFNGHDLIVEFESEDD